jgi:hypothetical protein
VSRSKSNAGRPGEHIPVARKQDAVPGREVRPALAPSDMVLSAPRGPLPMPGAGEQWGRPQISGAPDAVTGAPQSPPPVHEEALALGVDAQGGALVPKQLDGHPKPRRRPAGG